MELPVPAIPPTKEGGYESELARTLFVLRGLIFRAHLTLERSAKPWTHHTKEARFLLAQAKGIAHDAYQALPQSLRQGSGQTPDPLAVRGTQRKGGRR